MEMVLAIVVAAAAIFFGALISVGHERQRRAIDALSEQLILWAVQDLRLKREKLVRDVQVEDPLRWLNNIAAKVTGFNLHLRVVEFFDEPPALLCSSEDGSRTVLLSPVSRNQIRKIKHAGFSKLSEFGIRNPLFSLPKTAKAYELSVFNAGIFFDQELPLAWQGLTGQQTDQIESLWIYMS